MKDNELVSIITPTYKSKKFIMDTIESVLNQSYQNWELIIVDDASNDGIEEYIRSQTDDKRIKIITKIKNEGAARARNDAIKVSQGRYLAFLDSDDLWEKDKLRKQIKFMKDNQHAFTFTSYTIFNNDTLSKLVAVPPVVDYEYFLKNTIIATSTVVLDKNKVKNYYMVDVRQDHDSMTWLRIMREEKYLAYGLNEVLTTYIKRDESLSRNKIKASLIHLKNLRNYEKLNFAKLFYVFIHYGFNAFIKHYMNDRNGQ